MSDSRGILIARINSIVEGMSPSALIESVKILKVIEDHDSQTHSMVAAIKDKLKRDRNPREVELANRIKDYFKHESH